MLGKLTARTTAAVTQRAIQLIRRERQPVRTITADNGTEFHDYARIERQTGTTFYFATPHHAWERGTNENTNGLLRQYLPKAPEHGAPSRSTTVPASPAPSTPAPASATTIGRPRTAMPSSPERPKHHYRGERCTSHLILPRSWLLTAARELQALATV